MDSRDLIQVILGVVALRPDSILLNASVHQSLLVYYATKFYPNLFDRMAEFVLIHAILFVLGIGLLMGGGFFLTRFIIALASVGGAGGFLLIAESTSPFVQQLQSHIQSAVDLLLPIISRPIIADVYVAAPFVLTAIGAVRWIGAGKRRARKVMELAKEAQRVYCPFCGLYLGVGKKKCDDCGMVIPKAADRYCTSCGRPVFRAAKFCWWCGEPILIGEEQTCIVCGSPMASDATYCHRCGRRVI